MGDKLSARQRLVISVLFIVLLVVSIITNVVLIVKNSSSGNEGQTASKVDYPLLSRRIFLDSPNDVLINFVPLRKSIEKKLAAVDAHKSFYFEYLSGGTSIRVGSNNELVAASLIKLPLAMNLFKAAELGRIDLDKTVTVQESDLDGAYGELWRKGAGYTITLRQAAQLMLEKSDNTAAHVVFDHVKGLLKEDEQSLNQLDIEQNLQNGQAVIDAESYASVLRSLYLSSYLNKTDSQEVLTYLTHSEETRRLTAQLPDGVTVAHKNGVFNSSWSESDCGIVYVPKRPYILCIMLGLPEEQSNLLIAQLSREIYDYVVSQP